MPVVQPLLGRIHHKIPERSCLQAMAGVRRHVRHSAESDPPESDESRRGLGDTPSFECRNS